MKHTSKPIPGSTKKRGRPRTSDNGKILSDREEEILGLLKQGKQYAHIAEALFISLNTVKRHTQKIYRKLQVNNRTGAINKHYGKIGKQQKP